MSQDELTTGSHIRQMRRSRGLLLKGLNALNRDPQFAEECLERVLNSMAAQIQVLEGERNE